MKVLKLIGKAAILILIVGLFLLAIYGTYRLVRAHSVVLFFYGYLLLGLLNAFGGSVIAWRAVKQRGLLSRERVIGDFHRASLSRETLRRVRNTVTSVLQSIVAFLVWPAYALHGILLARRISSPWGSLPLRAQASLIPVEPYVSAASLAVILLAQATLWRSAAHEAYGVILLVLMLTAIMGRHLSYSLHPSWLPSHLRRTVGNAYVYFVFIAVMDCLSLLIAFGALTHPVGDSVRYSAHIQELATDMFRFQRVYAIARGDTSQPIDFAVACAGLLYYLAVLRLILRIKEFARTDGDLRSIGSLLCASGQFVRAFNCLRKVRERGRTTTLAMIPVYLGVNQVERACESAARGLEQDGAKPGLREVLLAVFGAAVACPIPVQCLLGALKHAIAMGATDVELHTAAAIVVQFSEASPQDVLSLLEDDQRAPYPLTRATMLLGQRDYAAAEDVLSALTPEETWGALLRDVLLLKASISNPQTTVEQDKLKVREWLSEHLVELKALPAQLKFDWELFNAVEILGTVVALLEVLAPERKEECAFIVAELKSKLGRSQNHEVALAAVERFHERLEKRVRSLARP